MMNRSLQQYSIHKKRIQNAARDQSCS